eukprot:gene13253-4084_t
MKHLSLTVGHFEVVLVSLISPTLGTLYGNVNINQIKLANHIQALSVSQQRLLRRDPSLMPSIARGAKIAIMQCQKQFRNRRWNCSSHHSESVFGKIVRMACRETAFAYAITAAGVSYALTRACSDGSLKGCQCVSSNRHKLTSEGWEYEGCHDNVKFGYRIGKRFVDSRERGRDFRATVNLHNNEAGRMAVSSLTEVSCRCNGVSGSCQVKVCSRKLSSFDQVGALLKEKYDTAPRVQVAQVKARRRIRDHKIKPVKQFIKDITSGDLVYYEDSPDFCHYDLSTSSLGTRGRQCNNASLGIDGCDLLCCSRGWKVIKVSRQKNCDCRFTWCCDVQCRSCKHSNHISICN